jgi:hypothetical protein
MDRSDVRFFEIGLSRVEILMCLLSACSSDNPGSRAFILVQAQADKPGFYQLKARKEDKLG